VSAMTSIVVKQEAQLPQTAAQLSTATATATNIESNLIWQAVSTQIEKIRKELLDSRKSVADAGKHSASGDAASSSARPTGFGR